MRSAVVVAGFVLSCTASVIAEDGQPHPISLQQAVERVQTAGFEVRMAQADARAASADAANAKALLRPQIGISGNLLDANEPQLGMPVARQAYGAATLSIPLLNAWNRLSARAADETARSAETGVSATTSDAVFATVQAYRKVQLADAVIVARRAAVADQSTHLRRTEERVAVGKSPRYLTLRDRASVASAQQALEDAGSERDQAAYDLAAILDVSPDTVSVEPLFRMTMNGTRESVLTRALHQRPSLLAAEQRALSARTAIAAAQRAYRPIATLTAQSYNGDSSPLVGRGGGQVQLTASLPVVDGGSRAAAVAKAQAAYDRTIAARDQARASVVRDVASAWREYEAATRNLATATAVEADAQEQLRLVTLRQGVGKAIDVEVLDALSVAAGSRETVVRSIGRYDIAIAAIHHAAGDLSP